jgi:hypothetical protein
MVTLKDFMKSRARVGGSAIYSQCFLAVDLLVKQHGVQPVVDYFSLFRRSDDRLGNFRAVFGQDCLLLKKSIRLTCKAGFSNRVIPISVHRYSFVPVRLLAHKMQASRMQTGVVSSPPRHSLLPFPRFSAR